MIQQATSIPIGDNHHIEYFVDGNGHCLRICQKHIPQIYVWSQVIIVETDLIPALIQALQQAQAQLLQLKDDA